MALFSKWLLSLPLGYKQVLQLGDGLDELGDVGVDGRDVEQDGIDCLKGDLDRSVDYRPAQADLHYSLLEPHDWLSDHMRQQAPQVTQSM